MGRRIVPVRLRDESGFALAVAIFALVLLAAIVASGYYSASQEFQIGRGMKSLTTSFYAGEAGVREVVANWDAATYGNLAIGDTVSIGPVTLSGGGEYEVNVVRVGIPADSAKRYFYIEAAGRPGPASQGERRQAAMVSAWFPDLCCEGAVKLTGDISFTGGGPPSKRITGNVQDPPGTWSLATCTGVPGDSVPGARVAPATLVDDMSRVAGTPVDTSVQAGLDPGNLLSFGAYDYDDLVSRADHTLAPAYTMYDSQPTLDASGACDESNPLNWGDPNDSSHPCFDYFPVIHATGTLTLEGGGSAQGILLVDGDLNVNDGYDFYGIAIVKGTFRLQGSTNFWGGAIVRSDVILNGATPRFFFSQCAVWRAERLSNLSRPQLLSQRAWIELF